MANKLHLALRKFIKNSFSLVYGQVGKLALRHKIRGNLARDYKESYIVAYRSAK